MLLSPTLQRLTCGVVAAAVVAASAATMTVAHVRAQAGAPTAAEARALLDEVNREMLRLSNEANRAGWVQSTYITSDTEALAAQGQRSADRAVTEFAKRAARFDQVQVPPATRRQLTLLKNALTMSAPPDPKEAEELTRLVAAMEGIYGTRQVLPAGQDRATTASTSRRSPRFSRRAATRSGCRRSGKAGTPSRCR